MSRGRRRLRWLVLSTGLLAVGGGAWWAANSSLVDAGRVEVAGASRLTRAEVVELSGVDEGTNVLWLRTEEVEERLEGDPWIAWARVRRDLPSTVRITVRERVPVAQIRVGRTLLLVARDATVLDAAPRDPSLPILEVTDSGPYTLGRRTAELSGPAAAAGALRPAVRASVEWIAPEQEGSLLLHLGGGRTVYFGPPVSLRAKDRALSGILRWMRETGRGLAYVDLRTPLAPAARPVGVGGTTSAAT